MNQSGLLRVFVYSVRNPFRSETARTGRARTCPKDRLIQTIESLRETPAPEQLTLQQKLRDILRDVHLAAIDQDVARCSRIFARGHRCRRKTVRTQRTRAADPVAIVSRHITRRPRERADDIAPVLVRLAPARTVREQK